MQDSVALLIAALRTEGDAAMRGAPEVRHDWQSRERALVLRIPRIRPEGFDVELEANADGLELRCGGMHTPLDVATEPIEAVQAALGLVPDLLSPGMRLRELLAGGRPYRWIVEVRSSDEWHREYEMALLVWNVFGRPSERIYQNDHLPIRGPHCRPPRSNVAEHADELFAFFPLRLDSADSYARTAVMWRPCAAKGKDRVR